MKKVFYFLLLLLSPCSSFAFDTSINITQPDSVKGRAGYSFELADSLVQANDIEKALWIYINLYPIDSVRVQQSITAILENIPNPRMAIQEAFLIN